MSLFLTLNCCPIFISISFFFIRMASEASKRAEEDRMRRIQLQEEQDLAYAIALSKAEAVSLKQN